MQKLKLLIKSLIAFFDPETRFPSVIDTNTYPFVACGETHYDNRQAFDAARANDLNVGEKYVALLRIHSYLYQKNEESQRLLLRAFMIISTNGMHFPKECELLRNEWKNDYNTFILKTMVENAKS